MKRTSKWFNRSDPWRTSWYRLWLAIPVLIEVLSCTACGSGFDGLADGQGLAAPTPPFADGELVRVKRVYDGDTILLEDGRKVRYLGINAPEFQEPFYLKANMLSG